MPTIIYGTAYDESLGEQLRVTVIATGLSSTRRAEPGRTTTPLTVVQHQQPLRSGTDNIPIMNSFTQPHGSTQVTAPPTHMYEGVQTSSVWRGARTQAAAKVDALASNGMDEIETASTWWWPTSTAPARAPWSRRSSRSSSMHEVLDRKGRLRATRDELFEALSTEQFSAVHRFLADEILQQIEQRIARIDIQGAAMLLVEIGADKAVFGSAERLASWVGICPGNNESAGSARAGASAEATPGCAGCCASSRKPLPERAAR